MAENKDRFVADGEGAVYVKDKKITPAERRKANRLLRKLFPKDDDLEKQLRK